MLLHTIAVKASKMLTKHSPNSFSASKVRYGIETLLTSFFNVFLIMMCAYMFGVMKEAIFLLSSYVLLRLFAGGIHLSTYSRCVAFGLLLFIGGALAAHYIAQQASQPLLQICIVLTGILGLVLCHQYAPAIYHYRTFTHEKKKKLYRFSLGIIIFWTILTILFSFNLPSSLILSSIFGILIEIWMLTPNAYTWIRKIEGSIERR